MPFWYEILSVLDINIFFWSHVNSLANLAAHQSHISHIQAVRHDSSPPQTPTFCFREFQAHNRLLSTMNLLADDQPMQIQIPTHHDHFKITPATPLPSPRQPEHPDTPTNDNQPLERTCSVYRNRKIDEHEENFYKSTTINVDDYNLQMPQPPFIPGMPNGGHHPHWADELCEGDRDIGVCTCDHIEVNAGLSAIWGIFTILLTFSREF